MTFSFVMAELLRVLTTLPENRGQDKGPEPTSLCPQELAELSVQKDVAVSMER
jgi:hypothetical protein